MAGLPRGAPAAKASRGDPAVRAAAPRHLAKGSQGSQRGRLGVCCSIIGAGGRQGLGVRGKKGKKGKKGRETRRQGAGGGSSALRCRERAHREQKGGEEGKEWGERPLIAGEEPAGASRGGRGAGEKHHLKESQARGRKDWR